MNLNQYAGWALVLGSIVLLITRGNLDLLLILLPLSLLLACTFACPGHHKSRLTRGMKRGSL